MPPAQRARFTTAYAPDPRSGQLTVLDSAETSYWHAPPLFPDAGGGLVPSSLHNVTSPLMEAARVAADLRRLRLVHQHGLEHADQV